MTPPARAEVIELVDKTKLNGSVVHYYDGVYSIEANGQTIKLPKEKIRSISFSCPPRAPSSRRPRRPSSAGARRSTRAPSRRSSTATPSCTRACSRRRWASGDAQGGLKKMQKEIEGTKFQIKGSSTKGDTATLKVLRQKGDESDTGEIAFVRENGEWKMLPPAMTETPARS